MGASVAKTSTTRNNGEKTCTKCGSLGPFTKKSDGRDGLTSRCNACLSAYKKGWKKRNPEKVSAHSHPTNDSNRLKRQQHSAKNRKLHPDRMMHATAKHRAKKIGVQFNLEHSDVFIPQYCPLLGIELKRSATDKACPTSPSLDRKDPTKGYIKGNVWVISHKANIMKSDATLEELELLTTNLRRALNP